MNIRSVMRSPGTRSRLLPPPRLGPALRRPRRAKWCAIALESSACSSATTSQTQAHRGRTNKNSVGDFGEITRAFVALFRSQQCTCKSSDALMRGMIGIV